LRISLSKALACASSAGVGIRVRHEARRSVISRHPTSRCCWARSAECRSQCRAAADPAPRRATRGRGRRRNRRVFGRSLIPAIGCHGISDRCALVSSESRLTASPMISSLRMMASCRIRSAKKASSARQNRTRVRSARRDARRCAGSPRGSVQWSCSRSDEVQRRGGLSGARHAGGKSTHVRAVRYKTVQRSNSRL
jgi:hypothetical protein